MSTLQEIVRAFLLSLGVFEVVTNTMFLIKGNGISLARKQHQELPKDLPDKRIMIKVVLMLLFGIAFSAVSIVSYILHGYLNYTILIILFLFSVYGVTEAMCYKYWRTWGFAGVTLVMLLFSIISL